MESSVRIERRFSIIEEWILDLPISDRAVRLYAVLARYADNETLKAFPSRKTLAKRLHCSAASIDRASQELIDAGVMEKQQRLNSSLIYTLKTSPDPRGVITGDEGGSSRVMRGVITGDDLTRTIELEPKNYLKKPKFTASDYSPSEKLRESFEEKYPGLDLDSELEAFIDHHLSKGSSFKDWDAAFRTWCRNALKWRPKGRAEIRQMAEGPSRRAWVKSLHDSGEHFACEPGEFGH